MGKHFKKTPFYVVLGSLAILILTTLIPTVTSSVVTEYIFPFLAPVSPTISFDPKKPVPTIETTEIKSAAMSQVRRKTLQLFAIRNRADESLAVSNVFMEVLNYKEDYGEYLYYTAGGTGGENTYGAFFSVIDGSIGVKPSVIADMNKILRHENSEKIDIIINSPEIVQIENTYMTIDSGKTEFYKFAYVPIDTGLYRAKLTMEYSLKGTTSSVSTEEFDFIVLREDDKPTFSEARKPNFEA